MKRDNNIYPSDFTNLINKFIRFLGHRSLEKCLKRYERSLNQAGQVYRDYYLSTRHPWFEAFQEYFALQKAGKSIAKSHSEKLAILAGDAYKIANLQKLMPEKIKDKYKKDLLVVERAFDYFFEICIAWHFFVKGCEIVWQDERAVKHAEFTVVDSDKGAEFDVECKRFNIDILRKVRSKDFYRLADKILPAIKDNGYAGSLYLTVENRLHGNDSYIRKIASDILALIANGNLFGTFQISAGTVDTELTEAKGLEIDKEECLGIIKPKDPSFRNAILFAEDKNHLVTDPIAMFIRAKKPDNIIDKIEERIIKAAKRQLEGTRAGLICCYLVGVDELNGLERDNELQRMTSECLLKDSLRHIAAVAYYSDLRFNKYFGYKEYFSQGLIFSNSKCKFINESQYKYLSEL